MCVRVCVCVWSLFMPPKQNKKESGKVITFEEYYLLGEGVPVLGIRCLDLHSENVISICWVLFDIF